MLPLIPPQLEPVATMTVVSGIALERSASAISTTNPSTFNLSIASTSAVLGEPISVGKSFQSLEVESNQTPPKLPITRLITTERGKQSRKFEFAQVPENTPTPENAEKEVKVIELTADKQQYDQNQGAIIASGNVLMRFGNAILKADRLQINLSDRLVVAQGNVVLVRGKQILNGERFEYYLVADRGVIYQANGEIYRPSFEQDLSQNGTSTNIPSLAPGVDQPIQNVVSTGGTQFVFGSVRDLKLTGQRLEAGGTVNRLRFQAEKIDFEGDVWQAQNIRLTNDPFSPPEVEIKADRADFKSITPLENRLTTTGSRVVFDDKIPVPLFLNDFSFDKRKRKPFFTDFGFDGEDKGGFYLQRSFDIINNEKVQWEITPQYLIQKAFVPNSFDVGEPNDSTSLIRPSAFGLESELNVSFTERTTLLARANLNSLDLSEFDDKVRAKIRLNQKLGELNNPYQLSLEYTYRDRLFNGSLGFQTVQSSFGAVLTSPEIEIGNTGASIIYQASIQNIYAETDRSDLIPPGQNEDLINLSRYQVAAILGKSFRLWEGEALPRTREEGLKYTPNPLVPYFQLNTGVTAVGSLYSNGDTQPSLTGTVGFEGQIGYLKDNFFDYTGFNISFSQGISGNSSPFKFDRFVDRTRLSFGFRQQVYGPVLFGFQTSYNLDTGEEISTDYLIEYSRRTYNIVLLYNPVLAIGSINLRINDFNWDGKSENFDKNPTD